MGSRTGLGMGMPVAAVLMLVFAGCSTPDSIPDAFTGLAADEIGCTIMYGSDSITEIGPFGVQDVQVFEPNEWTSFRIWHTDSDLSYSIRTEKSAAFGTIGFEEFPDDGVIAGEEMIDPGNPGYRVTCWESTG